MPSSRSRLRRDGIVAAQNVGGGVPQTALCRNVVVAAANVCGPIRYGALRRDDVAVAKEAGGKVQDGPRGCSGGRVHTDDDSRAEQPVGVSDRSVADGDGDTEQRAGAVGAVADAKERRAGRVRRRGYAIRRLRIIRLPGAATRTPGLAGRTLSMVVRSFAVHPRRERFDTAVTMPHRHRRERVWQTFMQLSAFLPRLPCPSEVLATSNARPSELCTDSFW